MNLRLYQASLFCTPVGENIEFLHIFNYRFHFEVIYVVTSINLQNSGK